MQNKYHFPIAINDLTDGKYIEIENALFKAISADKAIQEYLFEKCGSDPYDLDKPDADRIREHINGCVWRALEKAWAELEVTVKL